MAKTKAIAKRASTKVREQIREIRGEKILLDSDLASIYGVTTAAFNQAIRRNVSRFPTDFMFRLTTAEFRLISQTVISNGRGGRRKLPLAFTGHGALMAANVLRSPRAIRMSVEVVRAFVPLRRFSMSHQELAARVDQLEEKYDGQFK